MVPLNNNSSTIQADIHQNLISHMAHILAAQIHMTIIWVISLALGVTGLGGNDNKYFPANLILFSTKYKQRISFCM